MALNPLLLSNPQNGRKGKTLTGNGWKENCWLSFNFAKAFPYTWESENEEAGNPKKFLDFFNP